MKCVCLYLILILFVFTIGNVYSQNKHQKNFIGLLPSKYEKINGIAIGLVGSEVYCDYKISKQSNGLNIQLGQGILLTPIIFYKMNYLYLYNHSQIDSMLISADTSYYKAKHNGLLCSAFGTGTDLVNGVTLSGFFSVHKIVNGLSISFLGSNYYKLRGLSVALINKSIQTNGIQVGIYNNSVVLHGIQFGLWNKNQKRSLPIVNW
jgi:hypothetical protein